MSIVDPITLATIDAKREPWGKSHVCFVTDQEYEDMPAPVLTREET